MSTDGFGHTTKCPGCGSSIKTAAEAAAHVCPSPHPFAEPTVKEVMAAAEETNNRRIVRAAKRPTPQNLLSDGRKICEAVGTGWDGEVDCIVALVPVGTEDIATVRTSMSRERARSVLRRMLQRLENSEQKLNGQS